jgi:outer membrane protein, adhesin transport system
MSKSYFAIILSFHPKTLAKYQVLIVALLVSVTHHSIASPLPELLETAVRNNPNISSKRQLRRSYETDKMAARLRFLPSISYTKSGMAGSNNIAVPGSTFYALSLPLFDGGAAYYGLKKSDEQLTLSDYVIAEATTDIAVKVVSAYCEWYKDYEKSLIATDYVAKQESYFDVITERYKRGISSKADLALAESKLLQARSERISYVTQVSTDLANLEVLVGRHIIDSELSENIEAPLEINLDSDLIGLAVLNDPTLKRVKSENLIAYDDVKIARAQLFPQIMLQAQKQKEPGFSGASDISNSFYGITVQYFVGSGLSSFASYQASKIRAKSSSNNINTVINEITMRMSNVIGQYKSAAEQQKFVRNSTILSSEVTDSYYRQFLQGNKPLSEVMNSVRELETAKIGMVTISSNLIEASWKILLFTGQYKLD